jgi:hypothetical protein
MGEISNFFGQTDDFSGPKQFKHAEERTNFVNAQFAAKYSETVAQSADT